MLSAPWQALWQPGVLLGLCGLVVMGYFSIIVRRLRRWPGTSYQPVREDWEWYALVPLTAYGALIIAAVLLPGDPVPALFVVGAVLLLLLFTGIHNAWDVVTWIAFEGSARTEAQQQQNEPDE
jgi:drug/metabolite transporter (DMT)-like permease